MTDNEIRNRIKLNQEAEKRYSNTYEQEEEDNKAEYYISSDSTTWEQAIGIVLGVMVAMGLIASFIH